MAEIINIVVLTLFVNLSSTLISFVIGTLIGYQLFYSKSKLKKSIIILNRTFMGFPPVVMGLLIFLLFRRSGIFGFLELLYTVEALILVQVLIITPIISGHVYELLETKGANIIEFLNFLGANKRNQITTSFIELKESFIFIFIVGFSRAISEVGAIMIVGGNIRNKTRLMTTSISMLQSQGDFKSAIIFGICLIIISIIIQIIITIYKVSEQDVNL